jgi:cysteine desulfurase
MFHLQRNVYLDNNATTKVTPHVARAMSAVLKGRFGNPSSLYRLGRDAASVVEDARQVVAATINAAPDEIIFTGSATEANNQVLTALTEIHYPTRRKIVSTPIEHPSVMATLAHLERRGVVVEFLPVDRFGRLVFPALEAAIDGTTFLVCCMLANNEIGTLQDAARVTRIAHERGVAVLSDCVQALGKVPVDVRALGVDYATFSAHKLHGPKGVGALFVRSGAPLHPFVHGGHQEGGRRAGTENVHGIAGFAAACRSMPTLLPRMGETARRTQFFADELRRLRPDIIINSPQEHCLHNTLSVTFPGVNNTVLMAVLDQSGVAVSAGSACSSGETKASHVLTAIGLSEDAAHQTIRFSLGEDTSLSDLRYVLRVIGDHLNGKTPSIRALRPSQVDYGFLFSDANYILDVRFWHERKLLKGLPNSHEASFVSFRKYVHNVPPDKHVLVVCMGGVDAIPIAYSLKARGCDDVSFLLGGAVGWRLAQPDLYARYAGTNITALEPRARKSGR